RSAAEDVGHGFCEGDDESDEHDVLLVMAGDQPPKMWDMVSAKATMSPMSMMFSL
ncbi:hypothetical protein I5R65_22735, partial [Herbaspirillum sp. AP02]|nr:hypothetical protein [Herbaspirillum sp. AP02]